MLHTVPVNQGVWVGEVSLVVLLIIHHKLATETHKMPKSHIFRFCGVGRWV